MCGKPLIRNRRGIECGELHCEYSEDSAIASLESANAALKEQNENQRLAIKSFAESYDKLKAERDALKEDLEVERDACRGLGNCLESLRAERDALRARCAVLETTGKALLEFLPNSDPNFGANKYSTHLRAIMNFRAALDGAEKEKA